MPQKKSAKGASRSGRLARAGYDSFPSNLPVLACKDLVAFPSVMMALYISRPSSLKAVENALSGNKLIFVVAQRNQETEDPKINDLYKVGVIANVVRSLKMPDDRHKVLLQGITRAKVLQYRRGDYPETTVEPIATKPFKTTTATDRKVIERIRRNLQMLVEREYLPEEMLLATEEIDDPGVLADIVVAHYRLDIQRAQEALEELDSKRRLAITDGLILDAVNQCLISENIQDKTRDELNKGQREYYLREQIKQIQKELGENDGTSDDLERVRTALHKANLPKAAYKESTTQLSRLERMSPDSSEYALLRTYLDWIIELPWSVRTKDRLNLNLAKKILDQDHYGLDKAKDRILEYLAVRRLNKELKGSILCFVGPPGVGKTSLGSSIARALGRKFFRMSLGGVRDEAEIRGHRRTYVGALPGRIIQGLKQAGSKNCVFVLDELDKVGTDFRGDPASALLEVLDPHQNQEFRDHYLNISFDLSEVLFIATANTVDTIPEALLDRLEIVYISGYTTEEKMKIAERFIIPRQLKENGFEKVQPEFSIEVRQLIIERYTLEAGVRNLEREIGSLCRKVARQYSETNKIIKKITPAVVTKLLGPTKFDPEMNDTRDLVGLARGLAWTVNGGEIMPVEASIAKGNGTLNLTGQLGSVMQESAQAALFYARSNARSLGIDPGAHQKHDIHIHVPGGATPKDGPSAGVTIVCALVSALTGVPISGQYAMTGEITLRGNVLPVGGLKEKALAALRYGLRKVIIPFENMKDTEEIPKAQREKIEFIPVKHVGEVLERALLRRSKQQTQKKKRK